MVEIKRSITQISKDYNALKTRYKNTTLPASKKETITAKKIFWGIEKKPYKSLATIFESRYSRTLL